MLRLCSLAGSNLVFAIVFYCYMCGITLAQDLGSLRKALLFHASFDQGMDADVAKGEKWLFTAENMNKRENAKRGLPSGNEVVLERASGKFGGALRFNKSKGPMVFYRASGNFPDRTKNWSGTVSFWLNTDPQKELPDGFCDPIQITSKQWDDAALFVEFEKRPSGIPFRLGVYADKGVWNPMGLKFETIPPSERPLITVDRPPFAGSRWTNVVFVTTHFNTGAADGIATLYLDGEKAGELSTRQQTFSWDDNKAAIMLGLNYIGLMDDLAVFSRGLDSTEVKTLYGLQNGIRDLSQR